MPLCIYDTQRHVVRQYLYNYFFRESAIDNRSKTAAKPAIVLASIPSMGCIIILEIKARIMLTMAIMIRALLKFFISHLLLDL